MPRRLPLPLASPALLLIGGLLLQGCETAEGIGKDLSAAGQAVSGAAVENKGY